MEYQVIINLECEDAERLKERIKENNGYCLCALEQNDDTKCMCKAFREKEEGTCDCGLYKKIPKEELKELSINLSQLRSFVRKMDGKNGNLEIPFSLMCCLYPEAWKRIEKAMVDQYIQGYKAGKEETNGNTANN